MAVNLVPEDDSEPNATQMLESGDADRGTIPPANPSQLDDSKEAYQKPHDLETVIVRGEATQMETMEFSKDGSSEDISLTNISDLLGDQVTGEFSFDESKATGAVVANEVTGEFSVNGGTVNSGLTRFGTKPNTVRSGRNDQNSEEQMPEAVGNYRIQKVLGRGGMGVVYLARQIGLERDVALKMVLAGNHASKNQLARFEAEARAVAKLQHPNIVQVFEVGEHDKLPYFSLEFVDGMSLDQRLDGKPLPPRDAAQITEKICRAMQYAHDRGILHRDLKPANILLTIEGQPKVTDFGLAKQLEEEDSSATRAGTIMGTPSYMSPEQAQGLVDELTPASDQYSLGAMLYELLTGRPPFLGSKAFDTISQVVHKEPVPPCQLQETLPVDIDTICLKALQKTPDKRYANCQEMADDLGRFLRNEPILARPVGKLERTWRWCKRNPLIAIPTALATGLLLATACISTWSFLRISAQAVMIADERDNANEQRDEANKQRLIAVQNEEKAQRETEEAERQRILANEAKSQAEKNQLIAEKQANLALKNIQFFITEIDDRLSKQAGMNDLRIGMLEVLEKKWNELNTELTGGIQGQALPTLMAVRYKMAEAWVSLDKIEQANAQFELLEKLAQERLRDKNRNDASRLNLARILIRWAPLRQRIMADPAAAEKLQEDGENLLREILKDPRPEPGSPQPYEITDVLQQSLLRAASMKLKSGQLEQADLLYKEVQELNQTVINEVAANADWFQAISAERRPMIKNYFEQNCDLAKTGQANVLCRLGKADQAIPIYTQVIEARRSSVTAKPEDRNSRDQLALQLRNFGQNMMRVGKIDDAVRLLGQAHDLTQQNYIEDSTNANFKRSFGHSLYYWGVARAEAGQIPDSIALFERSRALRQEMFDVSPDQANKVNLMLSEARLGNQDAAEKWIDELSKIAAKDPDLRLDLARSLAQLSAQQQDETKKVTLLDRAIDSLNRAVSDGLADPFAISSEPDLKPLGQDDRFQALLRQLKR